MSIETIHIEKDIIKAELLGIGFKEADAQILYIPSLQMSAYGKNNEEAHKMMEDSLNDFFQTLLELKEQEARSILKDLGWKKSQVTKKRLENLSETTFDDIRREFDLPEDTLVEEVPLAV